MIKIKHIRLIKNIIMNSDIKIKELCQKFGITIDDLKSESRRRSVMSVRIILAARFRNHGLDKEEIGFLLGKGRDTISYYFQIFDHNKME